MENENNKVKKENVDEVDGKSESDNHLIGTLLKISEDVENEQEKLKLKKKAYTAEEDKQILKYVNMYGEKNWSQIAELMPGRNRKQLRDHYGNFLKKKLNKKEVTEKEDEIIFYMVKKHGHVWKKIADKLPGRTPIMIKNRYNSTIRKGNANSAKGSKIESIDCNGENYKEDLKNVIKNVTQEMQKLKIIPKK